MRTIRKIVVVGATMAALVGTGIGIGGTAASADPATLPSLTTLAGAGSDTITPLFAGLPSENVAGSITFDYNNESPAPANGLASWDAVNPSTSAVHDTITTKGSSSTDTHCSTQRPNGSSEGITALNNPNLTDGVDSSGHAIFCIDWTRSSRPANTTTFNDTFIALAKDAIAWSHPVISGQASPQPASLTRQDLINIYTCVDTNWDQVGTPVKGANAPIVPVLPQNGSGTRSTFLGDLGNPTLGSCVVNGVTKVTNLNIEENTGISNRAGDPNGNTAQFTGAGAQDDIFPYSVGDYIAQGTAVQGTGTAGTPAGAKVGGHTGPDFGEGNMVLGKTVDTLGVARPAITTNSSSQPVINPSFSSQFTRNLFAVVRNGWDQIPGHVAPANAQQAALPQGTSNTINGVTIPASAAYEVNGLAAAFGATSATGLCGSATLESDEVSYGFELLGGNCGGLTAGD